MSFKAKVADFHRQAIDPHAVQQRIRSITRIESLLSGRLRDVMTAVKNAMKATKDRELRRLLEASYLQLDKRLEEVLGALRALSDASMLKVETEGDALRTVISLKNQLQGEEDPHLDPVRDVLDAFVASRTASAKHASTIPYNGNYLDASLALQRAFFHDIMRGLEGKGGILRKLEGLHCEMVFNGATVQFDFALEEGVPMIDIMGGPVRARVFDLYTVRDAIRDIMAEIQRS